MPKTFLNVSATTYDLDGLAHFTENENEEQES